jgi:hypothetical protein
MTGWLREGYPILPRSLRESWGEEPLPSAIQRALGLPPTLLRDLDSGVWDRLGAPLRVATLANYVSALATSRLYFRRPGQIDAACDRPIIWTTLPAGLALEALPFRHRTRNVLTKADRLNDLSWASSVTASEFLGLKHAGVVTLLDFALVLEVHAGPLSGAAASLASAVVEVAPPSQSADPHDKEIILTQLETLIIRLRVDHNLENVSSRDPRLPTLGLPGATLNEVLENVIGSATASSVNEARAMVALVEELSQTLARLERQSLGMALTTLLAAVTKPKNVPILARRLGWDGSGGATLEASASGAGISRERVRQVEREALEELRGFLYCPPLDKALAVLEQAAHRLELDGPAALCEHGIADAEFLPVGVLTAAEALGRTAHFSVGRDGRAIFSVGEKEGESLRSAASSLGDLCFIASVYELQARAQEREAHDVPLSVVRAFLAGLDGVTWLDPEKNWFWLSGSRGSSIATATRKILSVSRRLPLESLRNGVLRPIQTRGAVVPRRIFEGLCRVIGCAVDGEWVIAPQELEGPDVLLPRAERILVETLRANENVMGLLDFRVECLRRGMNPYTCNVFTSYSPLLERVAPGIYALRGAAIDPVRVAFLHRSALAKRTSLQDHGWTEDGAVWIGYRATPGLINGGVIGFSQQIARLIGDRQYELRAEDGGRVGTLSVRNGTAWGLSSFFRRRGVEAGDCLVVLIDTAHEIAVVRVGSLELLQSYEDGDGEGPNKLFRSDVESIPDAERVEEETII